MVKNKKKSNYLNQKSSAPTVSINTSNTKFEKADAFIFFGVIIVLAVVIILGNRQDTSSPTTTSGGGNLQATTSGTSTPPTTAAAATTRAATGTASGTEEVVSLTETDSAKNNATDQPDASIEAKREAGSDQYGDLEQQEEIDDSTLNEMDGSKFKIGEGMHGMQEYQKAEKKSGWFSWMSDGKRENASVSDALVDELKRAKTQVKKESMKIKSVGLGGEEANIAEEIKQQGNRAKNLAKVKENFSMIAGTQQLAGPGGIPPHANVGGGPTDDPFDVFSSPVAKVQTDPNIDYTGYGHTNYVGGNVPQFNRKLYPRHNVVYRYEPSPLDKDYEHKMYSRSQVGNMPHSYYQISQQNRVIQDQRNTEGFNSTSLRPIDMKRQFPNHDFLPGMQPDFFKNEYMRVEREMAQELGSTGHSWTDNNPKSGLTNQPMGTGEEGNLGYMGSTKGQPVPPSAAGGAPNPALDSGALEEREADWAAVKVKVRGSVRKIAKLFDRLFYEELFPDAVVDKQDDGTILVRDGKEGECILLARYYEYVQATIQSTLGLGKTGPLTWAKSVDLHFSAIEKNKIPLRNALTRNCTNAKGFIIGKDGTIKTIDGRPIEINVPWPKDQTVLVSHQMKLNMV